MITVWKTGHDTNETVLNSVVEGLSAIGITPYVLHVDEYNGIIRPSLSYGVLRGTEPIYRDCERAGVPWWNIDRGFFKPSHFDGYYRIGYCHLQPTLEKIGSINAITSSERFNSLGISVESWRRNREGAILICPPTPAMSEFYGVSIGDWIEKCTAAIPKDLRSRIIIRRKKDSGDIKMILSECRLVIVFNSNIAMEALLNGVPAIAEEGIVRTWNKFTLQDAGRDPEEFEEGHNRYILFLKAAAVQFTLKEIASGKCWKTIPLENEVRI